RPLVAIGTGHALHALHALWPIRPFRSWRTLRTLWTLWTCRADGAFGGDRPDRHPLRGGGIRTSHSAIQGEGSLFVAIHDVDERRVMVRRPTGGAGDGHRGRRRGRPVDPLAVIRGNPTAPAVRVRVFALRICREPEVHIVPMRPARHIAAAARID